MNETTYPAVAKVAQRTTRLSETLEQVVTLVARLRQRLFQGVRKVRLEKGKAPQGHPVARKSTLLQHIYQNSQFYTFPIYKEAI